jgi:TP901 family phage tail tape measure protein
MSRQSIQAGKAVIVVELAEKATFQFDKLTASLSSRMMAASRSLRNTALNATGGFLMTGLAVRSTLKDFMNFESQMLNLAAKMGYVGNVTAEETAVMKDLSQTIINIGRSSAYTSQEVADAAISLAQAGFSAEELKGSLQGVIDLARGTNYALGESADFVANLVRTFEMFKNDDSLEQRTAKITSLTSQLVKSTRLGTIEIVDLREAFKYAGGTAKNLGVDVETLMGFFVQMSEAGLKASLAGTSINTMMLNLIRNVDLIKKKFPSFNIAMKDAGSIDLVSTNRQLLALTQNMDVASRTAFFQDIFNIRGARAFTAAMEIDRVENFTNSIRNAGAESRLAAMKMESGSKGGLQRFLSAIEALNIALGELYSKEITATLNSLAFLVTQFEEVAKKHKVMVAAFLLSPGILAAMAIGSFALSMILARLAVAMRAVTAAGRGLRFLGGTMISSAKGMASLFSPKGPSRAAQIAAQTKSVAKLNAQVTKMTASAMKRKTPAGQAKAMAAVNSSKSMQNLIAAQQKLAALQAKSGSGFVNTYNAIKQGTTSLWSSARASAVRLANVYRERKALKAQIGLEQAMGKFENQRTAKRLRSIKDVDVKQEARLARAAKYSALSAQAKERAALAANKLARQQTVYNKLNNAYKMVVPKQVDAGLRLSKVGGIGNLGRQIQLEGIIKRKNAALRELADIDRLHAMGDKKYNKARVAELNKTISSLQGWETRVKKQITRQTNIVTRAVRSEEIAKKAIRVKSAMSQTQQAYSAAVKEQRGYLALSDATQNKIGRAAAVNQKRQAARKLIGERQLAANTARTSRVAQAKQSLSSAKYFNFGSMFKTMLGPSKMLKGLFSGATLTKMGAGLLTVARGFLTLAGSTARFVFSWNFVGMVFNALLLFGDKIPVVVNAFSALGKGISGAFGQIGRIFTYAAPAFQLFQLAFNAFLQGDTGTGITALQTGFQGLVGIIGNQLTAAWNTFLEHVEYMWIFIMKIYSGLKMIFMSIFEGVKQTFGVVTSPLFSSLSDIFGAINGGGGGGLEIFARMFVTGVDSFITWLFKGAIFLNEQLMKFLASFQDVVGQIIGQLPGMGERGKAIQRDAATTDSIASMRGSMARAQLDIEQKKRAKEFEAMMNVNPGMVAVNRRRAAEDANQASKSIMDWMSGQVELGQNQYMNRINARDAEMARLQQETDQTKPPAETAQQLQQRMIQQTSAALESVTARLDRASLQKRTASSTELSSMYANLSTNSTYDPNFTSQQDVEALEQQKFMLQQQLAAMMDKSPYQSISSEMPKYLQALTGTAMSTRAIYRVDTKKQEDLLQQQLIQQEETNRLLRIGGGVQ